MMNKSVLGLFKVGFGCLNFLGLRGGGSLRSGVSLASLGVVLVFGIVMIPVEVRAEEELLEKIYYYVNDDIITKLDFEEAYKLAVQDPSLKSLSPKTLSNTVISNLINEKSIGYHAKLEGVYVRDEDIESEINRLMQNNNIRDRAQFDLMLGTQGISRDVFERQIRRNLLIQRYVSRKIDIEFPQDDEIMAYYETHKERAFKLDKPLYRLSWVLFKGGSRKTFSERKEIQSRAEMIRLDVSKGVLAFDKAVEQYSEDEVSRPNGGMLGWKKSETLSVSAEGLEEMNTLAKGDITSLYSSEKGVFFYKIEDVLKKGHVPYKVAVQEIRELIIKERREKAFQNIIANLHQFSYIKANSDEFDVKF